MNGTRQFTVSARSAIAALALCCWVPFTALAADETRDTSLVQQDASARANLLATSPLEFHPGMPMVLQPHPDSFSFDLGGSETRKLQLQLAHPLLLETHTQAYSGSGSNLIGLDATLSVPVGTSGVSLASGARQQAARSGFQSLGSIQCMNGTLRSDSYTASGCRFVDDSPDSSDFISTTLDVGVGYDSDNLSGSLNWFTSSSELGSPGARNFNTHVTPPVFDNRLLTPMPGSSLAPGLPSAQFLTSEVSGIDLNFQVGFTTDRAGDIQLGLALTRVLDANYSSLYGETLSGQPTGAINWNLAQPFNSAMLGVEWSNGSFSSGIRGYYREPVNFLNRSNVQGVETFDVHFTWRTPWNASLSVGASNVLNAGAVENVAADKPVDRFESIYGRIPYVRYQQDL